MDVPEPSPSLPPRVLIHYSRDSEAHDDQVLRLAQQLRGDRVDAWLDRYEPAPPQGWPRWTIDQLERADFVVLVCTPSYRQLFEGKSKGRHESWCGHLVTQYLHDGKLDLERVVPVLFDACDDEESVPPLVRGATRHELPNEYPQLFSRLTRSLAIAPAPLDEIEPHGGMTEFTLADELAMLREKRKLRMVRGEDVSEVNAAILDLRRRMREGPNLESGEILGERYRLIEKLGGGGFAVVWKAWDEQRAEFVAIKVLHAQWAADLSRVERFRRGAEKMAQLHHERLVPILERPAQDEHHHFFVMPYYAGGDLSRAVTQAKLERDLALRAIADAINGLVHVHAQGMVHRDVKPANVLLDGRWRGHLADFDLVRAEDTTAGTRTGAAMGTFVYAAPEQLADSAKVDWKADLYAAGMCVLFVLLGEHPPAMVAKTNPDVIDGLDCAEGLKDAIRQAVAYAPKDRIIDCAQLAEAIFASGNSRTPTRSHVALSVIESGSGSVVIPSDRTTSLLKLLVQSRELLGVLILLVISMVYVAIVSQESKEEPEPEPEVATEPAEEPQVEPVPETKPKPPNGNEFLLELVNIEDPTKSLSWVERHRVLQVLEADPEVSKLVNTKLNLARDLYQINESPNPCADFITTLDRIRSARDVYFVEHLFPGKFTLPKARSENPEDAAKCKTVDVELTVVRELYMREFTNEIPARYLKKKKKK